MPNTHQEINASYLLGAQAAIILSQSRIKPEPFVNLLRKLLFSTEAQEVLIEGMAKLMPHSASRKIADIITKLSEKE